MLKTVSSITNALGSLNYQGTWNASTNSPALSSGSGTKGDYYVVGVAGTTALDGISNWGVGDWATFNGTVWQRVEGGADLNGVNVDFTGVASGPTYRSGDGSAAAPALAPSSDTDTGIYFGAGLVNVATGGALRAQVDGNRFSMGGARNSNATYESRYPASLQLWGDTSFQSFSNKMSNFKNNTFATGVATAIFTFSKGAGSAASTIVSQLGGVLRISLAAQYGGGTNIAEFVEIPFSLGVSGANNIALQTGTQRIVTSLNNTGGGSNTYALSLSATSNTAATLALTITRAGLANSHVCFELDMVSSADGAARILIPNQA
jgi:hypothetical protein